MPKITEFLKGNSEYGYEPVRTINPPGEKFQYSGGGFLVLEHLLETLEGKSIIELTRPFLDSLEMDEFSFEQQNLPGIDYAHGFNDQGEEIEGTRKMFPAFAAGAMSTSHSMAHFLEHLAHAYHDVNGSAGISHDTAHLMLHGTDKGCKKFMGCLMGLGIFIAQAEDNKFMVHQGANDGFRVIFLHCFDGPDRGKGIVAVANADFKGVLFNAEITQLILREMNFSGIDYSQFKTSFTAGPLKPEEIVNMGYKGLVFDAFKPTRPEAIVDRGPADPLARHNLLVGGKVIEVSNELFARADNLISDHLPKFDPALFGKQGKIMDSWETVRHNQAGVDQMVVELMTPAFIKYILISTKYHHGNHAPEICLEGKAQGLWKEILPRHQLEGHSELRIVLADQTDVFTHVRVSTYPDGGLTRLGLFKDLDDEVACLFRPLGEEQSVMYEEKIPQTIKPLSIKVDTSAEEIRENWSKIGPGEEFNNASLSLGAKMIAASNEHYSPAYLVLSPFGPMSMFDGLENARSRTLGHHEEMTFALATPRKIHRILVDFTSYVNNNPLDMVVYGRSQGKWLKLVDKTRVKGFAANYKAFEISSDHVFDEIKVESWPDGGMNRIKVYSYN